MLNEDVHIADIISGSKLIDISGEQQQIFLYDSKYYEFNPTAADDTLLCNLILRKLIQQGLMPGFFAFLVKNIDTYI